MANLIIKHTDNPYKLNLEASTTAINEPLEVVTMYYSIVNGRCAWCNLTLKNRNSKYINTHLKKHEQETPPV